MGVTYNNRIVTDGLVLCLDVASKRSYPGTGTTWTDLAGGNNGTLTNDPTFDDDNGGGISLSSTNDYISGGDTSSVNSHNTFCVWYKATGVPSHNDTAGGVLFCQSNAYDHGIITTHSWANQNFGYGIVINQPLRSANGTAPNNQVNFCVGLWNGSQLQIWINGEFSTSTNYITSPQVSSPSYQIGRWGWGSWYRYFNGLIYNVQLYNRALTPDEIRRNYLSTKERFA